MAETMGTGSSQDREKQLMEEAARITETLRQATEALRKAEGGETTEDESAVATLEPDGSQPDEFLVGTEAEETPEPTPEPVISPTPEPTPTPGEDNEKARPDNAGSETQVKKEVAKLLPIERERVAKGINNIGFIIERNKSDFLAKTFDKISVKFDKKSTIARFTRGLRDSYIKDADAAQKKAKAKKGVATKISNVAHVAKNILRPLRLIADATGMSPAGVQRLVMAGGMLMGRTTGAMKEARLANEEVMEKNRIDIDKATDAAWKIYEGAQQRAGKEVGGKEGKDNVSVDELKTAYLHEIPKDLQERLKNPTVANGVIQGTLRKHLSFDVTRLNKSIEKIKNNNKLSPDKKEVKIQQMLRRWENRLTDYDRVLTTAGTVDGYAMAARYAEATSKNVVRAATLQTLYLSLEKVWGGIAHIAHIGSGSGVHEVIKATHGAVSHAQEGTHANEVKIYPKNELYSTYGETEPPDPSDHSWQAEEARKALKALGVHEATQYDPAHDPMASAIENARNAAEAGTPGEDITIGNKEGDLVHTLEKLTLKHNFAGKFSGGGVLSAVEQGRNLNESENIIRLLQGHNIGGVVTAQEFAGAAKFENGVLHITNQAKWDEYLDRLHQHSGAIDTSEAQKWAGNVAYKARLHDAGFTGATAEEIPPYHGAVTNIDHPVEALSPVQEAVATSEAAQPSVEEVRSQVLAKMEGGMTEHMGHPISQSLEHATHNTLSPEDLLHNKPGVPEVAAEHAPVIEPDKPGTYKPYNLQSALDAQKMNAERMANNPGIGTYQAYNQPQPLQNFFGGAQMDALSQQIDSVYHENIIHMFPADYPGHPGFEKALDIAMKTPAEEMVEMSHETELNVGDEWYTRFFKYFDKIHEVLGEDFKPKGAGLFRKAETTEQFIRRALKKAAEKGVLDKLKLE